MTRPWVAIEAAIRVNHKIVALPSDSARFGWVCVLGEAKQQRPAGAFRSLTHLREAAGRFARFIPKYQEQQLLEVAPTLCDRCVKRWPGIRDGAVIVHDWHVHQRDPGAPERAKDWRDNADRTDDERLPNEKRTRGDTDLSRALSLSESSSLSQPPGEDEPYQVATPPEAGPLRDLADELTGRGNSLPNVWGGLGEKAVLLARKHGLPAVEREWRRIAAEERGMPTVRQLVFGADEALNRIRRTPTVTESAEERDARDLAELRAKAARNLAAGGVSR